MASRLNLKGKPNATGEQAPRASEPPPVAEGPKAQPLRGDERKLHEQLTQMYAAIGVSLQGLASMRGDLALVAGGANIAVQAAAAADAWIDLARQNERVKHMLQGLVTGSSFAQLAMIHASMIVPIAAFRGMMPRELGILLMKPEARDVAARFEASMQQNAAAAAAHAGPPSNGTTP